MSVEEAKPMGAGETPLRSSLLGRYARLWMTCILLLADAAGLTLAGATAIGVRMLMGGLIIKPFYSLLLPLLITFLVAYILRGLYPAVGLSPVEEIRRLTTSTSIVWLFLIALTFWVRSAMLYSRLVFAFFIILAIVFVPAMRWIVRSIAILLGLWGEPVVMIGCGAQSRQVASFLLKRPYLGLRPVAYMCCLDTPNHADPSLPAFLFGCQGDDVILLQTGIQTALMPSSELPPDLQNAITNEQYVKLHRIILIPDLDWIGSVGIIPHEMEGLLGLEVRHNLLNVWEQTIKRCMDIIIGLLSGLISIPLVLLLALIVRLDSPGRVFYKAIRVGKGGRTFAMWKLRSMVFDGEQTLSEYLARNPQEQKEYRINHKLKNDPRITRVGRVLRRYSLDELPQIWNVLKGEMSMVGPRPHMIHEIEHYQQGFAFYKQVTPGITGLWQVSGRADVSYEERIRLDEYYVRNWSIWMDLYILTRTIWVLIHRRGAY